MLTRDTTHTKHVWCQVVLFIIIVTICNLIFYIVFHRNGAGKKQRTQNKMCHLCIYRRCYVLIAHKFNSLSILPLHRNSLIVFISQLALCENLLVSINHFRCSRLERKSSIAIVSWFSYNNNNKLAHHLESSTCAPLRWDFAHKFQFVSVSNDFSALNSVAQSSRKTFKKHILSKWYKYPIVTAPFCIALCSVLPTKFALCMHFNGFISIVQL